VILDIGMSGLNGYDTCRAIRRNPASRDIVVIALTFWGQECDIRQTKKRASTSHRQTAEASLLIGVLESLLSRRNRPTL
jgi:CheY-like chemotaxis protein